MLPRSFEDQTERRLLTYLQVTRGSYKTEDRTISEIMAENSLSKIPYWDGKAENFGVYVSKIEAYAEFMGVGDALDP